MFDFSLYEILVFGIIALIVLGPEKLPQAVRTAGTYYAKFRRTVGTIKAEMEAELDLAETRQKMQEELAKIKQAELEMQQEMARLRGSVEQIKRQSALDDAQNVPTSPSAQSTASQTAVSKNTVSKNTVSKNTVSKNTVSKNTVSKNTVSKNTVSPPNKVLSDKISSNADSVATHLKEPNHEAMS